MNNKDPTFTLSEMGTQWRREETQYNFIFQESLWLLYGEDWRETKKEAKRPVRKLEIIHIKDEGGLN